ncbi:MAG: beta-ketoacyl-[acyl-carrier-protein] synthase II [Bacteroidia bacterium]|nr:MAG: beta-ketoacyl-[acyl-carrier-protein] synthase II [Bacteroidia bacterium]
MTSKKRVVVTGMGIVSPVGNDLATNWHNITNGISDIDQITRFDTSGYVTTIAGEIKNFSTEGFLEDKEARKMDLFVRFGVVAGIQAVIDSGLNDSNVDKNRIGAIIGSGIGGLPLIEETAKTLFNKGPRRISPFFIVGSLSNMVAAHLSIRYGFRGVTYATTSACSSATHAIGDAMRYIQHGDCDAIVTGGSEGAICGLGIGGFNACKTLSTRNNDPKTASRPWDIDRDGFVMGEGAGVIVLEEYEHAIKRGAKIYAELVGYGATSDAFHITTPNTDGPQRCMEIAITSAGINATDIAYINAHGTSTPIGDINESNAIKATFKDHAKKLAISSTKSMTGHLLGGAGAIEAIYTILSVHHNIIPPTINIFNQDPQCDLDYTPNVARELTLNYALSNSFGFGGTNSVLIFKKCTHS